MKLGFFSILQLIFITLKIGKVIFWSWWLVLLPFELVALFWLLLLLGAIVAAED
jgi:hypothetical protein